MKCTHTKVDTPTELCLNLVIIHVSRSRKTLNFTTEFLVLRDNICYGFSCMTVRALDFQCYPTTFTAPTNGNIGLITTPMSFTAKLYIRLVSFMLQATVLFFCKNKMIADNKWF